LLIKMGDNSLIKIKEFEPNKILQKFEEMLNN
jgi:hypothetical protein